MRTTCAIAAMAALLAATDAADALTACGFGWRGPACVQVPQAPPAARTLDARGPADAAAEERDRLWAARCRPRVVFDALGVSRYVYEPGVTGCEFGQWRD